MREQGHDVVLLRESIQTGSNDTLVCVAAEANEAILVSHDADMKRLARRHGAGAGRFKYLSLIKLSCTEPRAVGRLSEAMSLVEHEWAVSRTQHTRRLHVEIGKGVITTRR